MKFYAVANGRNTGIYNNWANAQQQVKGFKGAVFKSFKTINEAEAFLKNPSYGKTVSKPRNASVKPIVTTHQGDSIQVYTDGSALGNPGSGGFGVTIKDGDSYSEYSGGCKLSTNNRMELYAVLAALIKLEDTKKPIVLHTDSKYIVDSITKGWVNKWSENDWVKSDKTPAQNPDLWKAILKRTESLNITFVWVKGHSGDPMNERVDKLANIAARKPNNPDDTGYFKTR